MLRFTAPVRTAIQRFGFLILIGSASGLLVLGKADVLVVERLRTQVVDVATPVLQLMAEPVDAVHAAVAEIEHLWWLRGENERLRAENARLLRWMEVARHGEEENARLRALLHVVADPRADFVTARVIADNGGPFLRTMVLDAGSRDGVEKGQAVVGDAGQLALVGRIAEIGQRSARVLLLTDLNSRIPVVVENSRYRAIVAGDNSDQLRLEYLPSSAQVSAGDRVLTSGSGGVFPPGLPVGVVVSVSDNVVRVQPFVDRHRVEMVSVVRYAIPAPEAAERAGVRW